MLKWKSNPGGSTPGVRNMDIIAELRSLENPKNIAGMKRFGIQGNKILGISVVELRKIAKKIGKSHRVALKLWDSGIHEARILACLVDIPGEVSETQMDTWVKDFDSWDVCDQVCMNLFDKMPIAFKKAGEWARREEEFVRRAGFALMAALAVHDKKATNKQFSAFFPIIIKYSTDERNFVKKAVNWALRQIGKRNRELRIMAIQQAKTILERHPDSRSARWIARDAMRELLKISKLGSSNPRG